MIASLRGKPSHFGDQSVVLDVQGVGYEIHLSERYREQLQRTNADEVTILTWLAHREDSMELFGFESRQEKELFLLLNRVSGVGLRTALAIVSALPVVEIITAIAANQPKSLCRAPGIGQKTAQRIILELREKLAKLYPTLPVSITDGPLEPAVQEEVEMTLLALGYGPDEIARAWSLLPSEAQNQDADEVIRFLLGHLSG
jgi:holliday junction DNA helicase RuvA